MPILLYHHDEVFIVCDGRNPIFLIDDDGTLRSRELEADVRVIPVVSRLFYDNDAAHQYVP